MIQTVTGKIDSCELGAVLMHEHISCSSLSYEKAFGQEWLNKKELSNLAIKVLKSLTEKYGVGLFVDGTPIDLGRDAALLKEVSELSGVRIVASTGFYYLQSIEAINNSAEELAAWLISECKNGIRGTFVKPGILKCATGEFGITSDNKKKLSALAIVQKETGLPIYVHSEHRDDVTFRQLEILLENGADINKIIIGHAAIRPDADYLKKVLDFGCYVCMDQCHCYPKRIAEIADALANLCGSGYAKRLLLSNDYCIHSDFANRNRNGLHLDETEHVRGFGYIFDKLYSEFLMRGGSDDYWKMMTCKNPIEAINV